MSEQDPSRTRSLETTAMLSALKERAVKEEDILTELTTLMKELEEAAESVATPERADLFSGKAATFTRLVNEFYGDNVEGEEKMAFITKRMSGIRHTMNTLLERKSLTQEEVVAYLTTYVDRVNRFVALLERRDALVAKYKE